MSAETRKRKPWQNASGFDDPTAYTAIQQISKEEKALDDRVTGLIHVLKFIIDACGFELMARIQIRDKKTGRVFR